MFKLEAVNADHGDALLLHWGEKTPQLAIIDGGPRGVFKNRLCGVLQALRNEADHGALDVRLVMVSHIDDDHITGVLDLFQWLKDLRDDQQTLPLSVAALWHNSFNGALLSAKVTPSSFPASVTPAALETGRLPACVMGKLSTEMKAIVASIPQGNRLRQLAEGLDVVVNPGFDSLVMAGVSRARKVNLGELTLTIVSPNSARLEDLRKEWAKKKRAKATPAEVAEYLDKSVPNLSSIVVLAECDDVRMLLTGDARGDDILDGLERAKLMTRGGKIQIDVLKLPHHGSSRDVDSDFFNRIAAKHYVISANGRYDNPDVETLELLTESRGDAAYHIWMTNDVPRARKFFAADRKKNANRRYEVTWPHDGAVSIVVPP